MTFRTGFQLPAIKGTDLWPEEIQAPPVNRIYVNAEDYAKAPEQLTDAVIATVRESAGKISQFFNAMRQQAQLSDTQQTRKRHAVDGVEMDYQNNQGTEVFTLFVTPPPPAPGGREPVTLDMEIPMDEVLDVRVDFTYWPFPGAQAYGNPPEDWVRGGNYVAFYDPIYEHESIVNPLIADPVYVDQTQFDTTDHRRNIWYTAFTWRGTGADRTPLNIGGFDETMLLREQVGKTGIYPELLTGKQYWEVEIVALPSGVPEGYTYTALADLPAYGNVNDSILQRSEDGVVTVRYPSALNTFFSPAIGIAPKYFKDLSFNKQTRMSTSMLGLDPDLTKPRSIAGVRTSNTRGDISITTFHYGGIYVDITISSGYYASPGRYYVCDLNAVDDRVSGEPLPSDRSWSVGTKNYRDGTVFQVIQNNGSVARDAGGPVNGNEIIGSLPEEALIYDGAWFGWYSTGPLVDYTWQAIGQIGGPMHARSTFPFYPGTSDPDLRPEIPGSTLVRVEHYHTTQTFPNVLYGDFVTYDAGLDTERVMVPLDTEGVNFPVLKGRGDFLGFYRDNIPAEEPAYDAVAGTRGDDWKVNGGSGVDTGVNLGEIAVGDRIMIATDVTNRKIWFGRNGVWYRPDGGEVTAKQIADGEGYTTLMDIEPGKDNPEYYPAATVKYGASHVRMHFGSTCRYTPPGGHLRISASKNLKLSIPMGDRPI